MVTHLAESAREAFTSASIPALISWGLLILLIMVSLGKDLALSSIIGNHGQIPVIG